MGGYSVFTEKRRDSNYTKINMVSQKVLKQKDLYLILHNIRSAHNVGAIFRTADATGGKKIFLTGYTPTPLDKLGKPRGDIAKTALGSQNEVVWEGFNDLTKLLCEMRKKKIEIIALEQSPDSIDYKKKILMAPGALLVGNEVRGLSARTLSKVDSIIEIPMKGKKESLNVSVACGVALFRLLDS